MRQLPLVACVVACLAVAACDGNSPTSPSPQTQVPQVAGTYAGSFDLIVDGSLLGSGTAQMTVVQAGAQLTITGSFILAGATLPSRAVTGRHGHHQCHRIRDDHERSASQLYESNLRHYRRS